MPQNQYPNLCKFFVPKPLTNHALNKCAEITKYVEVTMYELYQKVKQEEIDKNRKPNEEENCPICMCELYNGLEQTPENKLTEIHEA